MDLYTVNIHHPGTGLIVSASPDSLRPLSPLDLISLATIPATSLVSNIVPLSSSLTSTGWGWVSNSDTSALRTSFGKRTLRDPVGDGSYADGVIYGVIQNQALEEPSHHQFRR